MRTGIGCPHAGRIVRPRTTVRIHESTRGSESPRKHGQASGRAAQRAAHGDDIARAGTRSQDRWPTPEIPEGRHADGDRIAAHKVASREDRSRAPCFLQESCQEAIDPGHLRLGRQCKGHDQPGRLRSHGRDIGEVLGRSLMADVCGLRPIAPEVATLDQHVGRHDHASVGAGEHGSVVAGPDWDSGQRAHRLEDALDEGDLAEVPYCLRRHAASRWMDRIGPDPILVAALGAGCSRDRRVANLPGRSTQWGARLTGEST